MRVSVKPHDPAFGEADLSNCDRELIQFPGSIQPYGALLVLEPAEPVVVQASANAEALLGVAAERLVGEPIDVLGGDLSAQIRRRVWPELRAAPLSFRSFTERDGVRRGFETLLHRNADDAVILELVPADLAEAATAAKTTTRRAAEAVARLGAAPTLDALAAATVAIYRELAGYDRVMFYRFDVDGHGEVIAEAKEDHLEPYLGLHYPASDIPQRARELYLRNRVRVLADVHYEPVPLVPRLFPPTGNELDMSMSWLRSMSPLHLQYLKNMGVTATLVASLVREGELWGLVACHHYSPKQVPYAVRAACDLVAEVVATRIAVLENYAKVRTAALVRRLEGRLLEATWSHGEWRRALLDDPRGLLQMVGATGAALAYDDELLTAGDVPSSAELRSLVEWVATQPAQAGVFATASLPRDEPGFASLAATASGVLAVELSRSEREYLVWLRGEQVREVRWAGNPHKPVLPGRDPRELSPRRSFAVWTEEVQGTARQWSGAEIATAQAVGVSLRDLALQVRSMSYLITEDRLARLRRSLQSSADGVLIADGAGRIRYVNEAFSRLFRRPHVHLADLEDLPRLFHDPVAARAMVHAVLEDRQSWRGELRLDAGAGAAVPVAVRADAIGRLDGAGALGHIVLVTDMSERREADTARDRVQRAIVDAQRPFAQADTATDASGEFQDLIRAVLSNASLAVMEVADDADAPAVVPTLDGLEAATRRAADLTLQLIAYAANGDGEASDDVLSTDDRPTIQFLK
jgi:light-regulated signal transduction histidine kinase (bacteriophytochrome)